jgi:hypothetical protein
VGGEARPRMERPLVALGPVPAVSFSPPPLTSTLDRGFRAANSPGPAPVGPVENPESPAQMGCAIRELGTDFADLGTSTMLRLRAQSHRGGGRLTSRSVKNWVRFASPRKEALVRTGPEMARQSPARAAAPSGFRVSSAISLIAAESDPFGAYMSTSARYSLLARAVGSVTAFPARGERQRRVAMRPTVDQRRV